MRLVSSIAVIAALALAACGQPATTASTEATTTEQAATTTTEAGAGSMSMSMTAQAGGSAQEAAQCMAYTTMQRTAILSGHAQGDAVALLRATAAWHNSVAQQPEANQYYQAAMSAYATMSPADLKAAADDCVARAPAG